MRVLIVALLAGVSTPALAGDFYNMACRDDQREWTLALSTTGDGRVQFWRDDHPRVRVGAYQQNGDDVVARLEDMKVHLHVAWGNASWVAGDARGLLTCRYFGDQRLARWQNPAPEPPPFVAPPAPEYTPPPAIAEAPSAPSAGGRICDLQNTCYPAGPPSAGGSPSSVPVRIEGDQALVEAVVGGFPLTALVDSGATSLSLPQNTADTLLASGQAVEGPRLDVTHAGGEVLSRRSMTVNSVTVGGRTAHDVKCIIEPPGSAPLLGFRVLRQMAASGKVAINFAASTLDFE
jgi:gag-polyprotein putative aspartyl protease